MKTVLFERPIYKDEAAAQKWSAFRKRLEGLAKLELRGLGLQGTRLKPIGFGNCSLFFLRNGAQVYKYMRRYLIIASSKKVLDETVRLLKVDRDSIVAIKLPV